MSAHNESLADIRRGIRYVSSDRRFGFVETEGSRDVYVHRRSLDALPGLRVGSPVMFRLVTLADRRLIANDVALIEDEDAAAAQQQEELEHDDQAS